MDDIYSYFDRIMNNFSDTGLCYDLNGDQKIQVYDAALAYECVLNFPETQINPFHNHCIFPGGNMNDQQEVTLTISDLNQSEKYFDLDIKIPSKDIVAYQLIVDSMDINRAEYMDGSEAMIFQSNSKNVIALHGDASLERSADFKPFLRIYYNDFNRSQFCISPESDFVNTDFERVNIVFEKACEVNSNVENIESSSDDFGIYPNPFNDILTIDNKNSEKINLVEIIEATGKVVWSESFQTRNNTLNVNLNAIDQGYYMLRMILDDNRVVTSEIIKM